MADDRTGGGEPASLDRVATLFAEAIAIDDGAARERFVAAATSADATLRRELNALVHAHFAEGGLLQEEGALEVAGIATHLLDQVLVGRQLGNWRIERVIHRGGMGTVYRAVRVGADFDQTVALKVIRFGRESPDLVGRFSQERRLLATLEHPNIARLLDGGMSDDGMQYLVMEYVDGETIDVWCERERPSLDHLLRVFEQLCAAVQYAHRNLVVHRDIKPSNVLVTGDGTVKLLDFGIAELERKVASGAGEQGADARMMTPGYASPEQFRGEVVGTGTDTYSLGVLLYRLLTGRNPYGIEVSSSRSEAERLVCEVEPDAPSAVIRNEGRSAPPRAADLDAIVRRAMAKRPDDRYPSVSALAEDLRRYRSGFPVDAGPSGSGYRLRRYCTRNWGSLAAAAAILVLLVGGLTTSLAQAAEAQRQRDRATAQAATAEAAVGFLTTVLGAANPWLDTEPVETVDDVIRYAEAQVDPLLEARPEARMFVLSALGEVAAGRGDPEGADRFSAAAVDLLRETGDEAHPRAGYIYLTRALALHESGFVDAALPFAQAAVVHFRAVDGEWRQLANALNQQAVLLREMGEGEAAEVALREAIAIHAGQEEAAPQEAATLFNNLAVTLFEMPGRFEEVDAAYAQAQTLLEGSLASAPKLATLLTNRANILRLLGRTDEAEAMFARALELLNGSLGAGHPSTVMAAASLASMYDAMGDVQRGEEVLRGPLREAQGSLGADHPVTAYVQSVLASILCQRGQPGDAREGAELARASTETRMLSYPAGHWAIASAEAVLGYCFYRLGNHAAAEPILRRAHSTLREQRGEEQDLTVRAARWLAELNATLQPSAP